LQNRFIDALIDAFPDPQPGARPDVCLVLTLRADFYHAALRHRPLADKLQDRVENLGPMTRNELRKAIVKPAGQLEPSVTFEPGLAETILEVVEKRPGSLPLLQFALREMWGRLKTPLMTRAAYDAIGGVDGALARRAQAIFNEATRHEADAESVALFRRLFTRLVTLGEGAEDTRRIVSRAELGPEAWALAQRLAGEDNRLVVTAAPAGGQETAEVVHEALIRNWPALVEWVSRDRAFQSWLRQLKPRVDEWRTSPQDEGTLLRGGQLAVAEDWAGRRGSEVNEEEKAFVAASVAFRDKEKRRAEEEIERERARLRTQRRVQTLVGILMAAMALGAAAWWKQNWLKEETYALLNVTPLTTAQERALKPGDPFKECRDCPEMVFVPAGRLLMGSPAGQGDDAEHPQHEVTIAKFVAAKFALTFNEWDTCVRYGDCNPHVWDQGWGRGRRPAVNVSWDDAQTYVKWLSQLTGKHYRLLSEAENEYAARAGTETEYPWGNEIKLDGKAMANCKDCDSEWAGGMTAPVGSFPPNAFGLFDMVGNVWEWTEDCFNPNYNGAPGNGSAWTSGDCKLHAARGGAWNSDPKVLRSANRGKALLPFYQLGFRVARTLTP
jgi:formylglycine-generating enzyme required for sulfatase activity